MIQNGNLGDLYREQKKYQKSYQYLHKALKLSREISNRIYECQWIYNIGKLYYDLKKYDDSLILFHEALSLCEESQLKYLEGNILNWMAWAYDKKGNFEKSTSLHKKANLLWNQFS